MPEKLLLFRLFYLVSKNASFKTLLAHHSQATGIVALVTKAPADTAPKAVLNGMGVGRGDGDGGMPLVVYLVHVLINRTMV